MKTCTAKVGFFSLRNCDNVALWHCVECGRAICPEHSTEAKQCRDCAALQHQNQQSDTTQHHDYDDTWVEQRRREHYGSGYRPADWSSQRTRYDNYDSRSFVDRENDFEDESDGQVGFGDS